MVSGIVIRVSNANLEQDKIDQIEGNLLQVCFAARETIWERSDLALIHLLQSKVK